LNQFTAKRTVNRLLYHGSRIYAAYTIETGIDIYNSVGSYISSWSTPNRVTALSATGNYVYVGTDIGTIEVYNTSGTLITSWYVNGWPNSIAAISDRIFVADIEDSVVGVYNSLGYTRTTASLDTTSGAMKAISPEFTGITQAETITGDTLALGRKTEDTVAQVRIARLHNALQREVRMYSAASPNNTQFAIRLNSNGADRGGFYIRDDG